MATKFNAKTKLSITFLSLYCRRLFKGRDARQELTNASSASSCRRYWGPDAPLKQKLTNASGASSCRRHIAGVLNVHEYKRRDAVAGEKLVEIYGYFKALQVNETKFIFVYPLNQTFKLFFFTW
jgi:hypothetical protein